jgi:hypothetical protein
MSVEQSKAFNSQSEKYPSYAATEDLFPDDHNALDPIYQAKARVLNNAMQEIGMGRYQASLLSVRVSSTHTRHTDSGCSSL